MSAGTINGKFIDVAGLSIQGVPVVPGQGAGGVESINGATGVITFTGAVGQTGNTFNFTGGGGGGVAGTDGQLQYNNNGVFGGAGIEYGSTDQSLTATSTGNKISLDDGGIMTLTSDNGMTLTSYAGDIGITAITLNLNNTALYVAGANAGGTAGQYLASSGGGANTWEDIPAAGQVNTIVGGSNISVDSTNPVNPIVNVSIQNDTPTDGGGSIAFQSTDANTSETRLVYDAAYVINPNQHYLIGSPYEYTGAMLTTNLAVGDTVDLQSTKNILDTIGNGGSSNQAFLSRGAGYGATWETLATAPLTRPPTGDLFPLVCWDVSNNQLSLPWIGASGASYEQHFDVLNVGVGGLSFYVNNGYLTDNTNSTGTTGQVLTAGTGGQVVWGNGGGGGGIATVSSGSNISVDNTDPINPVVNLNVLAVGTVPAGSVPYSVSGLLSYDTLLEFIYTPTGGVLSANNIQPSSVLDLSTPCQINDGDGNLGITGQLLGKFSSQSKWLYPGIYSQDFNISSSTFPTTTISVGGVLTYVYSFSVTPPTGWTYLTTSGVISATMTSYDTTTNDGQNCWVVTSKVTGTNTIQIYLAAQPLSTNPVVITVGFYKWA